MVHGAFLLLGRPEFRGSVSIGVLLAATAAGVVLLGASIFDARHRARRGIRIR
jgi:hypothetical protein